MRKLGLIWILAAGVFFLPVQSNAMEAFVLEDIEMQGLARISEGTVLNYMTLREGETVSEDDIQLAIRTLFRAGFFRDIAVRRDGNTLVFEFNERPSIAEFTVTGNKDIETETLNQILRSEGLAEGRIFDQSVLEMMEQELLRVYHSRGKYSVRISTHVRELQNNLVEVDISISEGVAATIRNINIVGNGVFAEDALLKQMELKESHFWSWLDDDDKYSREKLVGDLEKLKSYYYNRGYADFDVTGVQVALSESKEDVFITLNVREGDVYTVSGSEFLGELIVKEDGLRPYVLLKEGDTFSMQMAEAGAELMVRRLEVEGYAFAEVEPIPQVDRESRQVKIVYRVDPGRRSFARSILFKGAPGTNDEVFRRELRQFEGAWLSNALLERSKVRIERLPYVEKVESSTVPVPGSDDLVDAVFDIKERSAGNFLFGVGFGGSATGVLLNASVTHSNFMGTGERVDVAAASSTFSKRISFSHRDPYATINGVSRTLSAYYTSAEAFGIGLEEFNTETFGFGVDYSYPISEYAYLGFGLNASRNDVSTQVPGSSLPLEEFITDPAHGDVTITPFGGFDLAGIEYNELAVSATVTWDTRNRSIFATRGSRRLIGTTVALAPGDVQYYQARFEQRNFFPLGGGYTITTNAELALADTYGDDSALPPGKRYFAGGFESVRGFRERYLGPRDVSTFDEAGQVLHQGTGYPVGGKLRTVLQSELLLPNFAAEDPTDPPENTQFSLFMDAGYLFREPGDFDVEEFRVSAGVAATFLTPIGALRFSYGFPIRYDASDRTERIQFTVGSVF